MADPINPNVVVWRGRIRQHLADIEHAAEVADDPLPYDLNDVLDDVTIDDLVDRLIADGLPAELWSGAGLSATKADQ
jgi:predicted Zn-dependent protease with MMP-like domain